MIPVPFPCQPGDRLRVTQDKPYGTELVTGDLVTVIDVGVHVEQHAPMPVVQVSTAYGRQLLGFDAVEPFEAPEYAPAEPDEIVDARLRAMLSADRELLTLFTDADTALGAEEAEVSGQLCTADDVKTAVGSRRTVGPPLTVTDQDGDVLEVTYFEQHHPVKGRQGGFLITINEEEAVIIPADSIDPLIRFFFQRKKHSERPDS